MPQRQAMTDPRGYLDPEDVNRVIGAADNLRDMLILRLLWRTGVRVSELLSIRLEDIDRRNRVLMVRSLKKRVQKERLTIKSQELDATLAELKRQGCTGFLIEPMATGFQVQYRNPHKSEAPQYRVVPLDRETLTLIDRYTSERSKQSPQLFSIRRQSVDEIIKRAGRAVGIYQVGQHQLHAHNFRHSFAVNLIRKAGRGGKQIEAARTLQSLLGHNSFDTTASYLQYSMEDLHATITSAFGDEADEP